MNTERLAMKGRLAEARLELERLRGKGEALCEDIRRRIAPLLTPLHEMEIAAAATLMDDLVMTQAQVLTLREEIRRLEKALA